MSVSTPPKQLCRLQILNGIHSHSKWDSLWWRPYTASTLPPSWPARNLALGPDRRSVPLLLGSITSWICRSGYKSFFMHELSWQKSMQKHKLLSFFLTNTTALHHGLWLGHIAPTSSTFLTCAHTSSTIVGEIHLNLSLNSLSSITLITYHTRSVQPKSHESREKISWYSASSEQAATLLSSVQESRLLKSNCSKSASLHCSTVIFSLPVWIPGAASSCSTIPGCIWGLETA